MGTADRLHGAARLQRRA